jgi:hypothetical protein
VCRGGGGGACARAGAGAALLCCCRCCSCRCRCRHSGKRRYAAQPRGPQRGGSSRGRGSGATAMQQQRLLRQVRAELLPGLCCSCCCSRGRSAALRHCQLYGLTVQSAGEAAACCCLRAAGSGAAPLPLPLCASSPSTELQLLQQLLLCSPLPGTESWQQLHPQLTAVRPGPAAQEGPAAPAPHSASQH